MIKRENHKAHIFICTKCMFLDENNKPCAEDTAAIFRKKVKDLAKEKWGDGVRINASGCLDRCEQGIAAVVYPQEVWTEKLRPGDEQKVIDTIAQCLASSNSESSSS